jgi:3-phosphoshikimate 1-carboxyvinyltransferase
MALSLLCSLTGGSIDEAEAVAKSYPDYFEKIKSLGIVIENEVR